MTILQSIFGVRQDRQREALVDLLLMAALADGEASLQDLDRIARAVETYEELQGYDWDEVMARAQAVAADGPLFADTREKIVRALGSSELRRFGLNLAARCCRAPLAEEEKALLNQLAELFGIDERERAKLLTPWKDASPLSSGYLRCTFNDPRSPKRLTWTEALSNAEDDAQLGMLTFKATATRAAMNLLSDATELLAVGELVDFDREALRVDAYMRTPERAWLARFLYRDEALFPREHELLPQLLDRVESSVSLFIGYTDSLPPPDEAALRRVAPERLKVQLLEL